MPTEFFDVDLNPQKVGSKPERRERACKRTAKVPRDFCGEEERRRE